jgi:succinate-semialdehyde dehydrogenase/glutarate-semialdehyde dehydrogenase
VSVQSVNPATGEVLERFEETSAPRLERILAGADATFREWRAVPLALGVWA